MSTEQNTRTRITTPALLRGEQCKVTSNANLTLPPSHTKNRSLSLFVSACIYAGDRQGTRGWVVGLRYKSGLASGVLTCDFRDLEIEFLSIVDVID
jgi:hypothetical protein